VLLIETGNVNGGNPVWQLNLEEGPHTTTEQTVLAREASAEAGGVE
jgi:hypothetical protein